MSRLVELEAAYGTRELILPCDCADGDYLRITWDDDPKWRLLWVETHRWPRGWKRAKVAWRALRGKPIHVDEVLLDEAKVAELRAFLDEVTATGSGASDE